jgi:predicted metalloprotease
MFGFINTSTFRRTAAALAASAALALPATAHASQDSMQVSPGATPDAEISAVNPSLLAFYTEAFRSWGLTYQPAAGAVYYDYVDVNGQTVTATCNGAQVETGIWGQYCPADQIVYLDYTQIQNEMNTRGSFSAGALFAHEIGHHVQGQVQLPYEQPYSELQADCLSGMYTRWALDSGYITPNDAQAGVDWAFDAGGGGDTGRESASHGTQHDRGVNWMAGFNEVDQSGDYFDASAACNGVAPVDGDTPVLGDPNQMFPIPGADLQSSTSVDPATAASDPMSLGNPGLDALVATGNPTLIGLAQSTIDHQSNDIATLFENNADDDQ